MTKKFIFLLLLMFTGLQIMQAQQTYSIKGGDYIQLYTIYIKQKPDND